MVVSREPKIVGLSLRLLDVLIATDGSFAENLYVRAPGTANGAYWCAENPALQYGAMNGRTVILQAVRKLGEATQEITARNGLALAQIDLFVPHQANLNLLQALGKRLAVPLERMVINLDRYGNTSGASAFLALHQAYNERRLRAGAYVLVLAFGAGFTWGAALCQVEQH